MANFQGVFVDVDLIPEGEQKMILVDHNGTTTMIEPITTDPESLKIFIEDNMARIKTLEQDVRDLKLRGV